MTTKTLIPTLLLSVLYGFVSGQGTKIIVLQNDTDYISTIMSYDYLSHSYDSLYRIPGTTHWLAQECAIDGINGRYFFGASITGYPSYTNFSFDITTKILTPLFQMNFEDGQGIEYDCFTNSLIYHDTDSLKRYDITTGTKSSICKIPHTNNVTISGFKRAYNYLDQQYLFIGETGENLNSHYYFVLVDALNASLIDTILLQSDELISYLTYDLTTNSFYGLGGYGITNIDSMAGNPIAICPVPIDFGGSLNQQTAVFDSYNGYYLFPYFSTNDTNKIAITNVSSSTIISVNSLPIKSNYHRLYSMQDALVKNQGGTLIASYASSYQWYLNGVLIPFAHSQIYTPTEIGDYTVQEVHLDGRITVSNVVTVNSLLSIEDNNFSKINIQIYPNPFSTQTVLQTDKVFKDATLTLYNSLGQQVRQVNNISGQTATLYRDNLPSGLYYLQLTQVNQTIATDKLIIMD